MAMPTDELAINVLAKDILATADPAWLLYFTVAAILANIALAFIAGWALLYAKRQFATSSEQATAAKEQATAEKEQVKAAMEQALAAKDTIKQAGAAIILSIDAIFEA